MVLFVLLLARLPLCKGDDFQNTTNSSWLFARKEALLKKGVGTLRRNVGFPNLLTLPLACSCQAFGGKWWRGRRRGRAAASSFFRGRRRSTR